MHDKAILPHEKLVATLRFLATGRSYKNLEFKPIMSKQTLSEIISETWKAIYKVVKNDYLKVTYLATLQCVILLHLFRYIDIRLFILL